VSTDCEKEKNQTNLFVGVETLLLKTETLNLVEILPSLIGYNIIGADSIDGSRGSVGGSVECQSCFSKSDLQENLFLKKKFKKEDKLYTLSSDC